MLPIPDQHRFCVRIPGRRSAFLVTDAIIAVILIMALAAIFLFGLRAYANARNDSYLRQRLLATAETELQRALVVGAAAMNDERLIGDLQVRIQRSPGGGAWTGFTLVTVECVGARTRGGELRELLSMYVSEPQKQPLPATEAP